MSLRKIVSICAAGVILLGWAQAAEASDARIAGAKKCTAYIPSFERQYGIPSHLLSAISSTETGRYHKGLKILLPWPWTINVEGKGYYFDSKAQAVAAVRKYQRQGKKSIDVGCMQVNLMHHPDAFANLDQAFEPKSNIHYAASFLRRLYESEKSWRKAAAAYHSKTPSRGSKYVGRVFRAWEKIVDRLRLPARDTTRLADAGFDGKDLVEGGSKAKPVKLSRASDTSNTQTQAKRERTRMKVIKVTDASFTRNKSDIMMIKPDLSPESIANAVQPAATAQAITRVDQPQDLPKYNRRPNIVRFDGAKPTGDIVEVASAEEKVQTRSGPRFIFTD